MTSLSFPTMVLQLGILSVVCATFAVPIAAQLQTEVQQSRPWKRHTIDTASNGADGIRIADVNQDGHPDFVTGWEEGGQIRIVVNPGPQKVNQPWPSVLVGKVAKPEDAVFVDIDNDGAVDVVSCCEGKNRQVFIHWAPKDSADYLKADQWTTETLPAAKGVSMWMFSLPLQVDGKHGVDLVCGAKGSDAAIGWFEAPSDPRQLDAWKWHPIYKAGWIMSLYARDIDGDGDQDILTTDRRAENQGCHWLENPGAGNGQDPSWKVHTINGQHEAMFATLADLDQDGKEDIVTCAKNPDRIFFYRRIQMKPPKWKTHTINWPTDLKSDPKHALVGGAKAVEVGDIDLDGDNDLVCTCEGAKGVSGAFWLSFDKSPTESNWSFHDIAGKQNGIKYDIVRLLDLDADGDLDAVTCEERDNLGVFWYKNPKQ